MDVNVHFLVTIPTQVIGHSVQVMADKILSTNNNNNENKT